MKQKLIVKIEILIIFILLICFQSGCVTNKKHKYQAYQDMKDLIFDEDSLRTSGYFLFFQTDVKYTIAYREANYLQSEFYYSSKFKNVDTESFFKDIMIGKTILPCGDLVECFTLSPVIVDEYKKKGLDKFAKMYATYYEESKEYIINPALSEDEKLSVAYYFYLNNIYTIYDCYSFDYISRRVPLYFIEIMSDDLKEVIERQPRPRLH